MNPNRLVTPSTARSAPLLSRRHWLAVAGLSTLGGVLTACGGGDDDGPHEAHKRVQALAQGLVKQGVVGVLDITVTRLEKTSFGKSFVGWDLDQGQKNSQPYFVRATVTNRGDTDLGGKKVPLYIVDGHNTLVEATTFASEFKPCEPGVFPKKFKTGKSIDACLVFLSPKNGDLTAVSFRPTQDFDPITWTGELKKPKKPKPDKGKGGKGGKGAGSAAG